MPKSYPVEYSVQSCGKAHAYCRVCRPEVRGGHRNWTPEQRAQTSEWRKANPTPPETAKKIGDANRGKKATMEHRQKISAGIKRHMERCDGACGLPACRPPQWRDTGIERILWNVLLAEFTVERSKRFGRFEVDAYLPEYHLAFEADGRYWHEVRYKAGHDAGRDAELMERFGLPVVRLTEAELNAMVR